VTLQGARGVRIRAKCHAAIFRSFDAETCSLVKFHAENRRKKCRSMIPLIRLPKTLDHATGFKT
jgi:hypothetical protein